MRELQRCFEQAQARAEAAEGQARELLAANAGLQARGQEEYASRQATAARVADLEVCPSQGQSPQAPGSWKQPSCCCT